MSNVASTFVSQATGFIAYMNQQWVEAGETVIKSVSNAIVFANQLKQYNTASFNVLLAEVKSKFPLIAKWYF